MSAKTKKPKARDFAAEAAAELDQIVSAYPNREAVELYDIAMQHCPAVRYWIEESIESAKKVEFRRLLRYSKVAMSDGRNVRANLSYKKWSQNDNGKEKQVVLWKRVEAMTRDECQDALRDLDEHIRGSVESRNAVVDYWNETHPKEPPIRHRESFR